MSYFLIYGSEYGTRAIQFRSSDKLKIYIENYCSDKAISFMEYIEEDKKEFYFDEFIVIKGEVLKPKAAFTVKTFEID